MREGGKDSGLKLGLTRSWGVRGSLKRQTGFLGFERDVLLGREMLAGGFFIKKRFTWDG
jgi:hypothetical protein